MGNQGQKKRPLFNKGQVDIACLKAKIHLQMMRDRKNQQIIKSEKELVAKLQGKSRSRAEEMLIMERVVNGLKYTQAANQLISYAISLKSMSTFLVENSNDLEKLQPWLTPLYSLIYAADQLGLSSLNDYKAVMRNMNNPVLVEKYANPDIKQLLMPTPSPFEVNIYVLEMCERNGIMLELVNVVGHKFQKDLHPPNNDPPPPTEPSNPPPPDLPGQFPNGGFDGWKNNDNNGNNNGNSGGFGDGGFGGGGQEGQKGPNSYYDNFHKNTYDKSPYSNGPDFFQPEQIKLRNTLQKPQEFRSNLDMRNSNTNAYPVMNPDTYKKESYKPYSPGFPQSDNNVGNKESSGQRVSQNPTLSQMMKDFKNG